jgi:hypothetical protein
MPYFGMLRSVALVITEVSKVRISSIVRVRRFGKIGTPLTIARNRNGVLFLVKLTQVGTRQNSSGASGESKGDC